MRCPGCGLCWVRRGDTACPTCGLLHPGRVGLAAQQGELDIAMRQIRGLQARGELDDDTAQRLRHLLEERQRLLRGEVATAKARAEPVIQPGAIHGKALPSPSQEALPDSPLRAPVPEPAPVPVVAASLPVAEAVPAPNPPPRQRFSGVLGGFMEERNILWGELVGGLLVVGCSLALVLTLWRSLEQLPYFPFLLFTALTAALFGAGQYTLHHWKLTSTSRGLLIIALLLLPLNLLVLGDTSAPRMAAVQALGWVDPLVTLAALLLLAVITRAAGRDLMGSSLSWHPRIGARELLVVAILGTAAVPLIGARLFEVTSAPRFLALAVLTVLCQVGATSAVLAGLTRSVRRGACAPDGTAGQRRAALPGTGEFRAGGGRGVLGGPCVWLGGSPAAPGRATDRCGGAGPGRGLADPSPADAARGQRSAHGGHGRCPGRSHRHARRHPAGLALARAVAARLRACRGQPGGGRLPLCTLGPHGGTRLPGSGRARRLPPDHGPIAGPRRC